MADSASKSSNSLGGDDEARFRLAIEAAPTGMLMVDQEGKIVLVNAQVEKLFGYAREALIGQPVEILVPSETRGRHPDFRAGFYRDLRTRPMGAGRDLFGRRRDGSEVPIEIGLNPLHTEAGIFVLSSIVDITERKRIESALQEKTEELERSNRDLEQFAYVASHDLREPLRMVATYVTLLEREYGDKLDGDAQKYIRFAVDGAARMARLVSDLLAYARVGSSTKPFELVDCNSVLREVLANVRASAEECRAEISVTELPTVRGDHSQLGQLFQNLLQNALKFRREVPPQIRIWAEPGDGQWIFRIDDNGIGVEARFFERIFELFQRLHGQDRYPGTGMGLALCKRIIERHGGRIWLTSEFGVGSTFSFCVPRVAEAGAAA
jgi:PAS domain S-box-containing protein